MIDILTNVLLSILTLDSIRAVIAMLGWIKPESKFSWIIYGRYDRNILMSALKDMGYSQEKANGVIQDLRKTAEKYQSLTGVKKDNSGIHLIILLSKYIEKFCQIQYGRKTLSNSNYYIDTMEISHSKKDLEIMVMIMIWLIKENLNVKPDIILVPKGGNPLFAQAVASAFDVGLIVVKSSDDNSRIITTEKDSIALFKINYEGSWKFLTNKTKSKTIVLDCNTSGGSQLLKLIHDTKKIIDDSQGQINLDSPKNAFVLFCVDKQGEKIDEKFSHSNSTLYRYFDLDEDTKKLLYDLKEQCKNENRLPDYYMESDRKKAQEIIDELKQKNKYYYKG